MIGPLKEGTLEYDNGPCRASLRRTARATTMWERNLVQFVPKKRPDRQTGSLKEGGDLLSHITAVPSAQTGLTSLFGKVRGEPRRYNHLSFKCAVSVPETVHCPPSADEYRDIRETKYRGKVNWPIKKSCAPFTEMKGRRSYISLWAISTTRLGHYCPYTYGLSTWQSPTAL